MIFFLKRYILFYYQGLCRVGEDGWYQGGLSPEGRAGLTGGRPRKALWEWRSRFLQNSLYYCSHWLPHLGRSPWEALYMNRFLRPASSTQLDPQEGAPRGLSLTGHCIQRPFLQESLPSSIPLMLYKKYPGLFNSCTRKKFAWQGLREWGWGLANQKQAKKSSKIVLCFHCDI